MVIRWSTVNGISENVKMLAIDRKLQASISPKRSILAEVDYSQISVPAQSARVSFSSQMYILSKQSVHET